MNTPKTFNEARRLAQTEERARDMFTTQGYVAYHNVGDVWSVITPNGPEQKTYAVTLGDKPHCTCLDFEKHQNYCKHILGLQWQLDLEEAEAMAEEYEKNRANAGVAEALLPENFGY